MKKIPFCVDKPRFNCYNIQVLNSDESLAQLAEHLTFNQGVRGSNPRWFTNKKSSLKKGAFLIGDCRIILTGFAYDQLNKADLGMLTRGKLRQ